MRILVVIGTRPEAVKMLPLVLELKKYGELETAVCFSGQHRELAGEVFDFFKVIPDFSFDAMREGQSLSELSVRLLKYFDDLLKKSTPDIVLTHGDTTTALCASLAAFYRGVAVGHIEAGLRTYRARSPFPEEFNRVAIDAISDLHFAPTALAAERLKKEGRGSALVVGNTGIDALKYTVCEGYFSSLLKEAGQRRILLLTAHRRENLGDRMRSSLLGVRDILERRNDLFAIFPIHPNPLVRELAGSVLDGIKNIKLCEPLPMYDFHNILSRSFAVLTDSGGIQEEAAFLGVPVFLLRDTTERPEGIECGNIRIIGTQREGIVSGFLSAVNDRQTLEAMQKRSKIFGDGNASEKIVKKLLSLS